MNAEPMAQLRLRASAFCGKVRGWLARTPAKVLVMFGLFLLAATLMALHTAFASKDATLHLKVQHSLRNADLSVWVDGDLAYSGKLKGSAKKKFGLIPDAIQGSLSEIVPLTSGAHQIRVRVVSDDGLIQDDSIAAEFAQHSQRELAITARRSSMQLAWQSSSGAAPTNSSWVSRYAGTLMLTIAGSIISALTGFALRELPAHIRSRQDIQPKAQSAAAGR